MTTNNWKPGSSNNSDWVEHRAEATQLVRLIRSQIEELGSRAHHILSANELDLIEKAEEDSTPITFRQLSWLRDIKDRLIEL